MDHGASEFMPILSSVRWVRVRQPFYFVVVNPPNFRTCATMTRRTRARRSGQLWLSPEIEYAPYSSWMVPQRVALGRQGEFQFDLFGDSTQGVDARLVRYRRRLLGLRAAGPLRFKL